ncbi:hypothetical protein CFIMG_008229RA00001 [Ceratocystis fimbriata CBS 114723]|uniref:Uncharacterized protein n=1 Tax=Ceratocystis fimbriata CBS 114723 TaxID=1035309 RepID=A0A2C5X5P6_9PEZI|nr:hypothetical protein CFIMG_008229RA00001 [Ceratocystis fimbriata CBS 114723]
MRFNPAIVVLAGSAIAAPAFEPRSALGTDLATGILPAEGKNLGLRTVDIQERDVAIAELMRRLETSSLSNLTSKAGITLPDKVVDQANNVAGSLPDVASLVVGLIINLRDSNPVLKGTPLKGVVNLVLPILEGVLSSLNVKELATRDLDDRSLDLVTDLLSKILSIATGLLSGIGGAGNIVGGLTGGLTGGAGGGDLLGGLTGGLTGGSGGAGDLLGGLTGGLTGGSGASGLTSLVTGALDGGSTDGLTSALTGAITKGSGLSAANMLAELPNIDTLTDLTNTESIAGNLSSITGSGNSTLSSQVLGKLADLIDFSLDGLSTVAAIPESIVPAPLNAPFRALAAELDALKPIVDSLKDILKGGLDVTNASDLTKLYDVLDQVYNGLLKLNDEIIPKSLQPATVTGLAGLLSVIKTVLTVTSGYIATASQAVKNAGGNPKGLTDSLGLINGN